MTALRQIHCAIDEWRDGPLKKIPFSAKAYESIYETHFKTLRDWHTYSSTRSKAAEALQMDLMIKGRCVSVLFCPSTVDPSLMIESLAESMLVSPSLPSPSQQMFIALPRSTSPVGSNNSPPCQHCHCLYSAVPFEVTFILDLLYGPLALYLLPIIKTTSPLAAYASSLFLFS